MGSSMSRYMFAATQSLHEDQESDHKTYIVSAAKLPCHLQIPLLNICLLYIVVLIIYLHFQFLISLAYIKTGS